MLESLDVLPLPLNRSQSRFNQAIDAPSIQENGRIRQPGFPPGLSASACLSLVQLQARVIEASRVLDRHRHALRLKPEAQIPQVDGLRLSSQKPLTPLIASKTKANLLYKREDLTATRAYKLRGAVVAMSKALESGSATRFLAVSTGNHALGILKAAELLCDETLKPESVRIVVPLNTAIGKLKKLQAALESLRAKSVEATLITHGQTFEQAREFAMRNVAPGEYYLDPYNDPWVVAGQGTLGLELVSQLIPYLKSGQYEEVVVIAPVGGGGLLSGTATALQLTSAWEPTVFDRVKLRFVGLRLSDLNSPLGDAIRVPKLADHNLDVLSALGVSLETMSNQDMADGKAFVQNDLGLSIEGASGGTLAPVLNQTQYAPSERRLVVCILSGANVD